jgi:hypothetical protein
MNIDNNFTYFQFIRYSKLVLYRNIFIKLTYIFYHKISTLEHFHNIFLKNLQNISSPLLPDLFLDFFFISLLNRDERADAIYTYIEFLSFTAVKLTLRSCFAQSFYLFSIYKIFKTCVIQKYIY